MDTTISDLIIFCQFQFSAHNIYISVSKTSTRTTCIKTSLITNNGVMSSQITCVTKEDVTRVSRNIISYKNMKFLRHQHAQHATDLSVLDDMGVFESFSFSPDCSRRARDGDETSDGIDNGSRRDQSILVDEIVSIISFMQQSENAAYDPSKKYTYHAAKLLYHRRSRSLNKDSRFGGSGDQSLVDERCRAKMLDWSFKVSVCFPSISSRHFEMNVFAISF